MKKYQVIYVDPPWRYSFSKSNSRKIENQYPTMSTEEICKIEVPAEDNSVIYMWATAPKLIEALEVMKAWKYTYKSNMIWDKEILGMGYWFRGQHELLLVGIKGKFSPPEASKRTGSVFKERRGMHSKKPDKIRDLIASWYPNCSKLEMFARQKRKNWDSWGNTVENDIEIEAATEITEKIETRDLFA